MNSINNLLEMSKLSHNQMQFILSSVEIRVLIWKVFSANMNAAHSKSLGYILIFQKDIPKYLLTDPNKMTQILMNLVGNAIEYTQIEGSVKVHVK